MRLDWSLSDRGLDTLSHVAVLTRATPGAAWTTASPEDARVVVARNALMLRMVKLPNEPIGVGGIWTVGGGGTRTVTTYRLVSRTGHRLVVEVIERLSYAPTKVASLQIEGSGSVDVDLDLPAPNRMTLEVSRVESFYDLVTVDSSGAPAAQPAKIRNERWVIASKAVH